MKKQASHFRFHSVLQLLLVVWIPLVSCQSGGGDSGETTPENTQPEAPGQALIEDRCAGCHDVETVYAESYSREGWISSINTMVSRGARLDEEERDLIVEYLLSR